MTERAAWNVIQAGACAVFPFPGLVRVRLAASGQTDELHGPSNHIIDYLLDNVVKKVEI